MDISEDTWAEVTGWFDRLIELDPDERIERIEQARLEPEVRLWLDRLFDAHDNPDTLLVDQSVEALVSELAIGNNAVELPGDWSNQQLGHWQIIRELKRGGMASVMLARRTDGTYEREVAIKVLHPGARPGGNERSLRKEIRLLAKLSHPGIVNLVDGGVTEAGWPYLVMEYITGEPIDRWCEQNRPSLSQRIELLRQVAAALMHAHQQLIVHADIKPSNVLVSEDGRVRLVDFGIASLTQADEQERHAPALRCSPAWASPEQLKGQPPTVANDVYGLGMLMYSVLTGQRLRQGSQITRLMTGLPVNQPVTAPSGVKDGLFDSRKLRGDLDAICLKALADEPSKRYASVEAMDQDLERWRTGYPAVAHPADLVYRLRKWFTRHRLPAIASTLAILALVGGTGVALWQAERASNQAVRAQLEANRATTIKDFLVSMFTAADPWVSGGDELDTRQVLRQGALRIESDNELDPATSVELLTVIADVQTALGGYGDARLLLDKALRIAESNPRLPELLKAEIWFERGVLHSVQDQFEEQEQALIQVRNLLMQGQAPNAKNLALRTEVQFASLLARQNRAEEALSAMARAEKLLTETPAPELEARRNLSTARGILEFNQGDLEQAYEHMQISLQLQSEMGDEDHVLMAKGLSNLAGVAAQLGRLDEALEHDQRAVAFTRKAYPVGHPGIAQALYALGDTYRQLGRFNESLTTLDESASIRRAAELDSAVAMTDSVRARTLLALGRWEEAAETASAARAVHESHWGETNRIVLQSIEFELAGRSMVGSEQAGDTLKLAEQRLNQTDSPARWQPIAQLLRWRMAWHLYASNEFDQSWRWVREARDAPPEISSHPTATLRLDGLELLLAIQPQPPSGVRSADQLIGQLEQQLNDPASHADARAFALCAMASAHQRSQAESDYASALERLQALSTARGLTFEGAGFIDCAGISQG